MIMFSLSCFSIRCLALRLVNVRWNVCVWGGGLRARRGGVAVDFICLNSLGSLCGGRRYEAFIGLVTVGA